MNPIDIDDEIAAIEAELLLRPSSEITGGQLFSLMGHIAPGLNFREVVGILKGPGALTEFVQRYLSGALIRKGNQGGDTLYVIASHPGCDWSSNESRDLWQNFVSPSSPRHIVFEQNRGRLVSRATIASAADGEIAIARATDDEHDRIRADFVGKLGPDDAAALAQHAPPTENFPIWIAALRRHLPDQVRNWGVYRRDRLLELFKERIRALGVDASLESKVIEQINASQLAAYQKPKEPSHERLDGAKPGAVSQLSRKNPDMPITRARELAHIAVDLMDYDELRAIRLPLGIILDAVYSKN